MINLNEKAVNTITACVDWVSATDTIGNTPIHYSIDGLENWQQTRGKLGYDIGYKHTNGCIRLVSSTRKDMGKHTIYSGKTLRRIEKDMNVKPLDILKHHIDNHDQVARIDVALDFVNCGLNVQLFVDNWYLKNVKTLAKSATYVQSITHSGSTFYIGSQKKRKKLLRIYDKASEQGIKGDWIRVELQVMGKPATQLARGLIKSDDKETYIAQSICGYCDFLTIPIIQSCKKGLETIELGSISGQKGDVRDWLKKQVIPSLAKEVIADAQYWTQFRLLLAEEIQKKGDYNGQ